MAQYQARWPVSVMGAVMQVSRSGFYAYVQRQASADGGAEAAALLTRVQAIAAETRHTYGSRRMAKPLQDDGFAVGRYQARRLMRQAKLTVQRRKQRQPVTTDSRHGYTVAPNLLARQLAVAKPNQVWGGDLTYVWTAEGWLYLGVLLDLYSRQVVGWAMRQRVDAALVQEALQMALGRRQPTAGLLHHSDRGSQNACGTYQALMAAFGMRCSMSRKGDCLDNAVAERFFGSLQGERTSLRHYASRQEAWDDVLDYIEMFYNSKRSHSYSGYVSPNDFERLARVA